MCLCLYSFYNLNIPRRVTRKMKIGIVIPCQKKQIGNLKRCFDSIEAQKVKPDYVVVSASGCEQSDIPQGLTYSFPFKILNFRKEFNQAENRNIAASLCKYERCTHISFFDMDSIMYSQRIQSIYAILQSKPLTDIILHSYTESKEEMKHHIGLNIIYNKLRQSKSGCAIVEGNLGARIHHSHCTVKREIWECIKFREEKEYEQKENAIFCGDVLAISDVQSIYIQEELSHI